MGCLGPRFTWCNGQTTLFPRAVICILSRIFSDHAPIILETNGAMSAGPKPFCFESCWVREDSSKVVIAGAWSIQVQGSASFRLVQRIKAAKVALEKWNKEVFGVVHARIKLLNDQLHFIQALVPSDINWEAEQRIQVDLLEASKQEECIWTQKSKITWLATLDINTRFFHLSTIIRMCKNNIEILKNDTRQWIQERRNIGTYIIGYFQRLFSSSCVEEAGLLKDLIQPVISQ